MHLPRTALVISGTAASLLLGAGAAIAGAADSSGVIHGCYTSKALHGSHVFVLQDAGTTCPAGTTAISWNQQGPPGPAGPAGAPGAQGPAGPAGATGAQGPAGANGSTVLSGTGGPASSLGNDGDFYLDTAADVLYGPKAGGSWPSPGVSLVGSTGPAGPQGPAGPPGAAAETGEDPFCPDAGALVIDGSGNQVNACNGTVGLTTVEQTADWFPALPSAEVVATCPPDAPYVTGGGGLTPGSGDSAVEGSLVSSYPDQGDPAAGTPGSWDVTGMYPPQESEPQPVTAIAICAGAAQGG